MSQGASPTKYRFSFGPWNISTGADPFGPPVRQELEFARKIRAVMDDGVLRVRVGGQNIINAIQSSRPQIFGNDRLAY